MLEGYFSSWFQKWLFSNIGIYTEYAVCLYIGGDNLIKLVMQF